MNRMRGFTLIELMIVIAIIGILTTFALPAYQNHTARAELTEALTLSAGLKPDVIAYYSETGTCLDNTTSGVATLPQATAIAGHYVAQIAAHQNDGQNGCAITATMKTDDVAAVIAGQTLTLFFVQSDSGTAANGSFTWQCRSSADARYLPSLCQSVPAQD